MCGVSLPSSSDLIMHDDDTSINRGAYPQKYTFGCNLRFVSQSVYSLDSTTTTHIHGGDFGFPLSLSL